MALVDRRIDVEHDAIGMRVLEREFQIGLTDTTRTVGGADAIRGRLFQRIGEFAEGFRPHRRQDVGLVLEIAVGRLGVAAQRLGQLPHRHAFIAEPGEALGRDAAEFGAKVGNILFG